MAEELLKQVHMAVIRGNVSEIQSLAGKDAQTKGVDAGTTSGLDEAAATAKALALSDYKRRKGYYYGREYDHSHYERMP